MLAMKNKTIKIGIVDDHKIVLEGLTNIFLASKEFEVVFAVSSGKEGLKNSLKQDIDILLLDVRLPNIDAASIVRYLKEEKPDLKIVCLSSFDSPYEISELFSLGISGYLTKTISKDDLFKALQSIMAGKVFIDPELKSTQKASFKQHTVLTPREIEIIRLVTKGYPNKAIAAELNISESTVKTHLKNIMEKLDVKNRAEIAFKAVINGIVYEHL
jgi:DNA-binding NarL/FixJ family response regulator